MAGLLGPAGGAGAARRGTRAVPRLFEVVVVHNLLSKYVQVESSTSQGFDESFDQGNCSYGRPPSPPLFLWGEDLWASAC